MKKILMMVEVSKKQDFIFSSKKLKDNVERSEIIANVTSDEYFKKMADSGELTYTDHNLVYAGGGHTILQFDSKEEATEFAAIISEKALRYFAGLELFIKQLEYDKQLSPADNIKALSKEMEKKKSLRKSTIRQVDIGIESAKEALKEAEVVKSKWLQEPKSFEYPNDFAELNENGKNDNFIAVVHLDGNAMGKRVEELGKRNIQDWDAYCDLLKKFSNSIQEDFGQAFLEMVQDVSRSKEIQAGKLPIRPIILAGDDVCFVTEGKIGLECARLVLEKLADKTNKGDGKSYSACAGVALVHTKYPFHKAYALSEALCSNAKIYGASLDSEGGVSAIDWHIEFGQLRESLEDIKEQYETDDGNYLSLRPLSVLSADRKPTQATDIRSYAFFHKMSRSLKVKKEEIGRSKIKMLRGVLKQGELESEYYIKCNNINKYIDSTTLFQDFEYGKKRCLYFDAIEMMDHCEFLEEVGCE